jgi:hypothetical protein
MVLPLTVAGRSPAAIFTDVPSAFMERVTLTLPHIPWLIVPAQLPANRAGPEAVGAFGDSLSKVLVFVLGFHLGFDACSGAGVGLSGVSTIGAGERWTVRKTTNITMTVI